jgi:AbrB family looped-hinge helix DNA binding protein
MTMLVKISPKGQLVIPQAIRKSLGLRKGTQFNIRLDGRKIVLEPAESLSPVDALYGKYADVDFLAELEREHQQELSRDR